MSEISDVNLLCSSSHFLDNDQQKSKVYVLDS